MDFANIDGVVLDGDGVLWSGRTALPGLGAFFELLRERNLPYVLATNNSSSTRADYVAKMAGLGINGVDEAWIVTSGTATLDYMRPRYPQGTPVHVLGGDGLKRVIADAGYERVDIGARVVVAGIDFDVTYERLKRAALQIRAGADFIGTNPDTTFPTPEGLCPGAGSILALLEVATDCKPIIIGKPYKPMFESALAILGEMPAERVLMVGDRLNTDIIGAQDAGLKTALMMTGVTDQQALTESGIAPDGVYDDLPALIQAWNG